MIWVGADLRAARPKVGPYLVVDFRPEESATMCVH